eukprot:m.58970 g.58970  ORF g.58970 m.58970 type:complete len:87 (-) comp22633_c1_seq2:133-393(-)
MPPVSRIVSKTHSTPYKVIFVTIGWRAWSFEGNDIIFVLITPTYSTSHSCVVCEHHPQHMCTPKLEIQTTNTIKQKNKNKQTNKRN